MRSQCWAMGGLISPRIRRGNGVRHGFAGQSPSPGRYGCLHEPMHLCPWASPWVPHCWYRCPAGLSYLLATRLPKHIQTTNGPLSMQSASPAPLGAPFPCFPPSHRWHAFGIGANLRLDPMVPFVFVQCVVGDTFGLPSCTDVPLGFLIALFEGSVHVWSNDCHIRAISVFSSSKDIGPTNLVVSPITDLRTWGLELAPVSSGSVPLLAACGGSRSHDCYCSLASLWLLHVALCYLAPVCAPSAIGRSEVGFARIQGAL